MLGYDVSEREQKKQQCSPHATARVMNVLNIILAKRFFPKFEVVQRVWVEI
jgi:hypothetical protein